MSQKGSGQKTALVVGAGVGGIGTAARLAKAGFKVTVLEKNAFNGGRCSLIHQDGYRFDRGPSLLLLPHLFREIYHDLDTTFEDEGIKLLKCEPNYHVWFHDGEFLRSSTDAAIMKDEIEKWEGKDGYDRYFGFMQESHRHYEISVEQILRKNFTSLLSMIRPNFFQHLIALHPFESIYSRVSRYFKTERLRRVFTFGSMYMGMSPYDAPGTYSLLQYTELAEGIWYPVGGFNKIIDAIAKIGERTGVEYRYSTPVSSILLSPDKKRACGVTLESGEQLKADVVICNADLVYAYNNLLPASSYARSLSTRPGSCSSISFYWSVDKIIPELNTHNIFLAEHYRESFDQIFNDLTLPDEPSFYLNVPSRVDPTAAPPGKDAVIVLVPVGHLRESPNSGELDDQDWSAFVARARKTVFRIVQARTGVDLEKHVVHEIVNTPQRWKETFNLDKGAILGLSHSFFNVLSFRPKTKHSSISDLYFVGASTHPGTGVPIVLAGTKITSDQILEDYGIPKPWGPGGVSKPASSSELDRVRSSSDHSWIFYLFLAAISAALAWNYARGRGGLSLTN